jgi:L-glyceraldehyde 3-phosphate reductase
MYIADKDRYGRMRYNRCGNSGVLLPIVSLGLWQNFGSLDDFEESRKMIHRAFDLGITHFDLANNYGPEPGTAEETFGKILEQDLRSYRDELIISTKAGYRMWEGPYGEFGSRKYLISSLDQSLKRMKLDYVDIFYSHRPDYETPLEETMSALAYIVQQGKALYVGISSYDHEYTRRAAGILKDLKTPCLIHQAKYSMLDRWVEHDLLDTIDSMGIGLIAFSPLAQGLLTEKYLEGDVPANSRIAKNYGTLRKNALSEDLVIKLRQLKQVAGERGQTLAQMSIAWLLKDKRVTSVIFGASSLEQLEENHRAIDGLGFSEDELTSIANILV